MATLKLTRNELIAMARSAGDTKSIFKKIAVKVVSDEQIWDRIKEVFSKEDNNTKFVTVGISEEGVCVEFKEEFVVDAFSTYSKVMFKAADIFKDLIQVTDEFRCKWLEEVADESADQIEAK